MRYFDPNARRVCLWAGTTAKDLHAALGFGVCLVLILAVGWPSPADAKSRTLAIDCEKLSNLWASARYKLLEDDDLEGLDWSHLELLRNGIYARHRMPFKPMRLRYFFAKNYPDYRAWKDWLKGRMNKMEIENAVFLGRYERKVRAHEARAKALRQGPLSYACQDGSSLAKTDSDPKWERWKPTPFPIAVHCSRIEAQSDEFSKRRISKKDVAVLRRKGWLHLTLLRNGLFAREGMAFENPWLRRFYRRFKWYQPKPKDEEIAFSATVEKNAKVLSALEEEIGTMRLEVQAYNLDLRCEGSQRLEALSLRQKVVLMALSFLGTDRFKYRKEVRRLQEQVGGAATSAKLADRYDCSGLVESVFQGLEVDLAQPAPRPYTHLNINGVKIIHYNLTKRFQQTCTKRDPKLGDLIFFDHCWDANNNGTSKDDPLTHIGIVTGIYPDGTVEFVHNAGQGMRRRIEIGRMNLQKPFSKSHNKPTPMCSGKVPAKIFTCYGFPEKAGEKDSEEPPLLAERSSKKKRSSQASAASEGEETEEAEASSSEQERRPHTDAEAEAEGKPETPPSKPHAQKRRTPEVQSEVEERLDSLEPGGREESEEGRQDKPRSSKKRPPPRSRKTKARRKSRRSEKKAKPRRTRPLAKKPKPRPSKVLAKTQDED